MSVVATFSMDVIKTTLLNCRVKRVRGCVTKFLNFGGRFLRKVLKLGFLPIRMICLENGKNALHSRVHFHISSSVATSKSYSM